MIHLTDVWLYPPSKQKQRCHPPLYILIIQNFRFKVASPVAELGSEFPHIIIMYFVARRILFLVDDRCAAAKVLTTSSAPLKV